MSPEQGRGQELDRRSDIYSLGIILYELATGRVPYSAQTPVAVIFKHVQDPLPPVEQINPNLPSSLVRVIYKALAKQPEDRIQTAGEMVEALEACLEEVRTQRQSAATVIEPPPPAPPAPPPVINPSIVTPVPTPALPTGAPRARRGLGGGALLGLGGLAGLLALGAVALVCGAVFLLPQLFGGQQGAETTRTPATAAGEPTETEQPERTPTRRAPTLTAPTAVLDDEPTPSAGGIVFRDDFEADSGWETRNDDDSLVEYRDGALVFEIYETRWRVPSLAPAGDLQNVRVQATVRIVGTESDPPVVGAICHHQPDGSYYYLGFSPDGYYGIVYFDGEDGVFLNTDEDSWQATPAIEKFADEYQFEVDCAADGTLRLAVNGVEIGTVVDDTLGSGEIGLFATSFNRVPVEVHFDDLVVSEAGLAGGDVLYQDDFSDSGSGWDTGSSTRRAMNYRDGVYAFEVFEPGWRITSEGSAGDLANIHAAVTVASVGASTDPGYGLLCNVQPNGAYYYLGFGPDGYYGIGYYDGESSRLLTNDNNDWIVSAGIEKYSDPYRLEADCAGDGTLRLIVDGVEIASVVDTTLASGNIGLFVSSFEEVPVEVHFDDLIVTALP
ncbi:MAG: protein kinase [Anaerolineales bacterium]|nr:protein kinase [Anaerolineales bacterium]